MKDDCSICGRLQQLRETIQGIAKLIYRGTQHLPRKEQFEFGLSLSHMESLDKEVVKMIYQHDSYHENGDFAKPKVLDKSIFGGNVATTKKKKKKKKKSKGITDDQI